MTLGSDWHKSTTSHTSGCVEVAWRKATASMNGNCVEVAFGPDGAIVQVRDSKNPGGAVLNFTPHEWQCFLDGVRRGEFDLPAERDRAAGQVPKAVG